MQNYKKLGRVACLTHLGLQEKIAVSWPWLNKIITRNVPHVSEPRYNRFVDNMWAGQDRARNAMDALPGYETTPRVRQLAGQSINYGAAASAAQEERFLHELAKRKLNG